MRQRQRSKRRVLASAVLSLGLIAAACGKKDGDNSTATSVAAAETTAASGGTDATVAPDTTLAGTTPPETTPAPTVTPGGEITISGEAEVANPWTPAAMQCDSYCQQRARSFFDPIAAIGEDTKVHPYLAESITPNADATQWTIKVRDGITFTDGTPVNADAVIENLQRSGLGLLLATQLTDIAKVPRRGRPDEERVEDRKGRRSDLHDLHRKGRRSCAAAAVAGLRLLPHRATRPHRLTDLARGGRRRSHQGDSAGRIRPVHRPELCPRATPSW